MKGEQTIYVLTRATVVNNTLEPQDIDSWVFPSFEEANEAMIDDWVATYDKTHGNPHDECEVPKKGNSTAWIQFDDGELEFIWHTVKGVRYELHCSVSCSKEESELLEHLRADLAYGNQQPSSGWRETPTREGSTTILNGSTLKRVEVLYPGNGVMI